MSFVRRNQEKADAMIRKWNDPILKTPCRPMLESEIDVVREIAKDLIFVAQWSPTRAVGLAAPQIGWDRQVIYICPKNTIPQIIINPKVETVSVETSIDTEGCLSFPGVTCMIERNEWVNISFDRIEKDKLIKDKMKLEGYKARVFQHEYDHIFGVCLIGNYWRNELGCRKPQMTII